MFATALIPPFCWVECGDVSDISTAILGDVVDPI